MLQQLRRAAKSIVAKVLLGLLVLSFALWGIGDVFRSQGTNTVATLGNKEIDAQQFRNEYDRERQSLTRRLGQPVSNEQAEAMGLRQRVLNQLITEAAFDEANDRLGMQISPDLVARDIQQDPSFRGPAGKFDRAHFARLLANNGYNEQLYLHERTQLIKRRLLADSLIAGLSVPPIYVAAVHRLQNETRTADYVILNADKFAHVSAPDEKMLAAYYEDVKSTYNTPERRQLKLLVLSPAEYAKTIIVSDTDARIVYEKNLSKYGKPEMRKVEQLSFADETAARAFAAKLPNASNTSADSVTRADLGWVKREDLIDPKVRDTAFSLALNTYSDVIQSQFGPVILRATEIQPAAVTPFDDVKAQIKNELATQRAREAIFNLHDEVETERASGASLDEISAKLKLPVTLTPLLDRNGNDENGKPAPLLNKDILEDAFAADIATDNEPAQSEDKGWVWFEVAKIDPQHERALIEVRAEVEKKWLENQQRIALSEAARTFVTDINKGKPIAALAMEKQLAVKSTAPFKRDSTVKDFSRSAVDAAFRTGQGKAGTGPASNDKDRVVFVVKNSEVPGVAKLDAKLADNITQGLHDDLLHQFVASLQKEFDLQVNTSLVERLANGADQ